MIGWYDFFHLMNIVQSQSFIYGRFIFFLSFECIYLMQLVNDFTMIYYFIYLHVQTTLRWLSLKFVPPQIFSNYLSSHYYYFLAECSYQ